jgi:hypothetical protein
MISRSIYNLKIDTICMCDIPFDRSILQLSNGIRHVTPSTDRKLELTAKRPCTKKPQNTRVLIIALFCRSLNNHNMHSFLSSLGSVTCGQRAVESPWMLQCLCFIKNELLCFAYWYDRFCCCYFIKSCNWIDILHCNLFLNIVTLLYLILL